jgi:hypothetical protein
LRSQSLREAELDKRRELGVILRDRDVVLKLLHVFESDWAAILPARSAYEKELPALPGQKPARAVVRQLPLAPIVESALKHAATDMPDLEVAGTEFGHNLTDAVREAVEDAVSGIVRQAAAVRV